MPVAFHFLPVHPVKNGTAFAQHIIYCIAWFISLGKTAIITTKIAGLLRHQLHYVVWKLDELARGWAMIFRLQSKNYLLRQKLTTPLVSLQRPNIWAKLGISGELFVKAWKLISSSSSSSMDIPRACMRSATLPERLFSHIGLDSRMPTASFRASYRAMVMMPSRTHLATSSISSECEEYIRGIHVALVHI